MAGGWALAQATIRHRAGDGASSGSRVLRTSGLALAKTPETILDAAKSRGFRSFDNRAFFATELWLVICSSKMTLLLLPQGFKPIVTLRWEGLAYSDFPFLLLAVCKVLSLFSDCLHSFRCHNSFYWLETLWQWRHR
jgi:hypothetical protein